MKTSFKELLGLLLLLTVPAVAQAQFTYTQNNGAIIITGYTGSGGSVFIPTTMFGLPVGIADGALSSPSITEITVGASNPYFSSVDGVLLTKSPLTVIQCPLGKTGSFTIPDGAREVGRGAFDGCRLSTVTIPSSVTSIGNRGFGDSYSLTSVTIPDSVIWMGDHVFAACTSLTNVTLDSNLGSRMFEGCRDLINVALGTNVTRIADGAFAYCTNLTRITIPNSVTNIGDGAFDGCSNLTNFWIGSGVASIGQAAFNLCWSLTAIDVDPLNAVYCSVDGVMFDRSQTVLVAYPGGKGASYTIPNGVTRIEDYAFYQCSSLTNVAIPDGVISIGDFAFTSTSLAGVTIPNAVTNLGANAFQFCNSLLEVTMPTGLTTIAGWLFCSCPRLTSITIPNGVTSIGDGAFVGCHSLTSVTVPDSASSIGGAAFWDCTSLTNVTIGNSVTNLGDYALNGCSNLRAIYFRGNAPSIDPSTFTGDTNATIYYRAGTTGWGPTFGGRPTAQWILPPPTIQMSPQTQTAEVGSTVGFQVQASGGLPLFYQWYRNFTNLVSRTTIGQMELSSVQFGQAGAYTVVVTNIAGSVTSSPAMLQVIARVWCRPVPGINVSGEPGSLLNVDYANSLSSPTNWTTVGSVSLANTSQYYFDLSMPLPSQRFYRVWQTGAPSMAPSLDLQMVPAVTLTGATGGSVRLDYINQFGPINAWVTLDTVTLTNASQLYFDVTAPGRPPRLYRVVQVP